MGHWDDFFFIITEQINSIDKKEEFFNMLKQLDSEKEFSHKEIRDKWEEAYIRILKSNG